VQITSSLDQRELALLDDWLAAHPRFHLRLHHGRQGPITDLEMLAGLPHVRHLTVDLRTCASIEGLRHARQLETLRLGAIGAGADLGPLRYLTEVRTLYLANPHRNTDVLAELGTLEDLTLRTTSLTNLDALTALPRLRVLDLQYGRFPSLDPLADFPALEHLEVQRIKHLGDIDIIARIPRLRRLMLAFLPGVTRLPDMSTATHLRDVCFEHMVGIVDLNPLAAAPGLEQVVLVDPPHTDPSGAARLATHPTLRGFSWITPRTRPSPLPPDFPKARLPDRRPFG
jgi:internalin A